MKTNYFLITLSILLAMTVSLQAADQSQPGYLQKALGQLVGQESLDKISQLFGTSQTGSTSTSKTSDEALHQALSSGDINAVRQALRSTTLDKETLINYALMAEENYLRTHKPNSKEIVTLLEQKLNLGSQPASSDSLGLASTYDKIRSYLGGTQTNQPTNTSIPASTNSDKSLADIIELIKKYTSAGAEQTPKPESTKHWYDYLTSK